MFRIYCLFLVAVAGSQPAAAVSQREEDSYRRWVDQDVVYIIAPEERDVYLKLANSEEKDKFIEQFWLRRDPDPSNAANEFKEEHYRRLAYTNDHFTAGIPGWKTDRGRVYITHGPPDDIERHAGGSYVRPYNEGGGTTSVFPFERWWYRHLPGIGDGLELEFVDDKGGGLYKLTTDPNRKDAFLYTPNAGGTDLENLGVISKVQRIVGHRLGPLALDEPDEFQRVQDRPLEKILTQARIHQPPPIQYKDLRQIVETKVTYSTLPFHLRADYFPVTVTDVLVPLTVDFDLAEIGFKSTNGVRTSELQVYGRISNLTGRLIGEFEDTIAQHLTGSEQSPGGRGFYQRKVVISPGVYKLDLVIKDSQSGRVGTLQQRLEAPVLKADEMALSSLIVADRIDSARESDHLDQLVFGSVRLVPSSRKIFPAHGSLGIYFQVYNVPVDMQTNQPLVRAEYSITPAGRPPAWKDITRFLRPSSRFLSFTRMVNLNQFTPGPHELRARLTDLTTGKQIERSDTFQVIGVSVRD